MNDLQKDALDKLQQLKPVFDELNIDIDDIDVKYEKYEGQNDEFLEISVTNPNYDAAFAGIAVDEDDTTTFLVVNDSIFHWHHDHFDGNRRQPGINEAFEHFKYLLYSKILVTRYTRSSVTYKEAIRFVDDMGNISRPETNFFGCLTSILFFLPFKQETIEISFKRMG